MNVVGVAMRRARRGKTKYATGIHCLAEGVSEPEVTAEDVMEEGVTEDARTMLE
jgi:hypothetical protein